MAAHLFFSQWWTDRLTMGFFLLRNGQPMG
jgi:hypothetical protein